MGERHIAPVGTVMVRSGVYRDGQWIITERQVPIRTMSDWANEMRDRFGAANEESMA